MNDNKYLDILLYVFIDRVDRTVDATVQWVVCGLRGGGGGGGGNWR